MMQEPGDYWCLINNLIESRYRISYNKDKPKSKTWLSSESFIVGVGKLYLCSLRSISSDLSKMSTVELGLLQVKKVKMSLDGQNELGQSEREKQTEVKEGHLEMLTFFFTCVPNFTRSGGIC